VSTLKRLPQLPNVPTIDESGLKGYEVTIWNGFFVAKNTPKDIITKLNQALVTTLGDEKVRARLIEQAVDLPAAKDATPEALRNQLKASIDKWVPAIKAAGVQPQ
jgi:tripartite-type tricarboxylate transporter receptor subunit TctC